VNIRVLSLLSVFAVGLAALLAAAPAAAKPPLRVALSGDAMPLHGKKGGSFEGFEVDLAQELARKLGRKIELVDLAALDKGSFDAIKDGDVDCSINSITDVDAPPEGVALTAPYMVLPYRVAAKKGTKVDDLATFEGKVAVLDRATRDVVKAKMPKATAVPQRSQKDAVLALMRGKIDLLAMDSARLKVAIKDTSMKMVGNELEDARLVIAVPSAELERFDKALAAIEPKIKKLRRKWMPELGAATVEIARLVEALPPAWVELERFKGKQVVPVYCESATGRISFVKREGVWFLELVVGLESVDGKIEDIELIKPNHYKIVYTGQNIELKYKAGAKTGQWGKSSEFWKGKWKTFADAQFEEEYGGVRVEKCK